VDCWGQARYSPEVPDASDEAKRATDPAVQAAEDAVPKLPRGRGLRLSRPQLVRIIGTLFLLIFLVTMQRPCATAVSGFVTGFGDRGSAATVMPRPGTVDVPAAGSAAPGDAGSGNAVPGLDQYEHLRPGMTEAELKAVIERARVKAADHDAAP
jgi:hypothetical protein